MLSARAQQRQAGAHAARPLLLIAHAPARLHRRRDVRDTRPPLRHDPALLAGRHARGYRRVAPQLHHLVEIPCGIDKGRARAEMGSQWWLREVRGPGMMHLGGDSGEFRGLFCAPDVAVAEEHELALVVDAHLGRKPAQHIATPATQSNHILTNRISQTPQRKAAQKHRRGGAVPRRKRKNTHARTLSQTLS